MNNNMKQLFSVFVLAAVLLFVGCNGCNNTSKQPDQPETKQPIKLKIGYIPIADCSQLFVGIEKGFFKEDHLSTPVFPNLNLAFGPVFES